MSITSQASKTGPFIAASYPQAISTGFPFQQASDLVVLDIGSVSTPIDPAHILALGSDYTVTGGGYDTANNMLVGTITLLAGGANNIQANDQFVFLRNPSENQIQSLINTGSNTATLIEQMGDKMATLSQQAEEGVSRSLRFEQSEFLDGTLPINLRKGNLLGFDSVGNIQWSAPLAGAAVPIATASTVGSVKPDGSTTLVSGTGVLSAPTGTIIPSIAALRLMTFTGWANKTKITVHSYYVSAAPDGGGDDFELDKTDTTTADNGGTVIVASDGTRLKRLYSGDLNLRWFGAKGDEVTDDTASLQAAVTWLHPNAIDASSKQQGGVIYFPAGRYLMNGTRVDLPAHITLRGDFSWTGSSENNYYCAQIISNITTPIIRMYGGNAIIGLDFIYTLTGGALATSGFIEIWDLDNEIRYCRFNGKDRAITLYGLPVAGKTASGRIIGNIFFNLFSTGANSAAIVFDTTNAAVSGNIIDDNFFNVDTGNGYTGKTGILVIGANGLEGTSISKSNFQNFGLANSTGIDVSGKGIGIRDSVFSGFGGATSQAIRIGNAGTTAGVEISTNHFYGNTRSVVSVGATSMRIGPNNYTGVGTNLVKDAASQIDDFGDQAVSWTPAISFGGGTTGITYSSQYGKYTKTGNMVTVSGRIALTNKGSSSGTARITGLPYAVASATDAYGSKGTAAYYNTASVNGGMFLVGEATTTLVIQTATAAGMSNISEANFTNTTEIDFTATYRAY